MENRLDNALTAATAIVDLINRVNAEDDSPAWLRSEYMQSALMTGVAVCLDAANMEADRLGRETQTT